MAVKTNQNPLNKAGLSLKDFIDMELKDLRDTTGIGRYLHFEKLDRGSLKVCCSKF
jgi:hypothetical protein